MGIMSHKPEWLVHEKGWERGGEREQRRERERERGEAEMTEYVAPKS